MPRIFKDAPQGSVSVPAPEHIQPIKDQRARVLMWIHYTTVDNRSLSITSSSLLKVNMQRGLVHNSH